MNKYKAGDRVYYYGEKWKYVGTIIQTGCVLHREGLPNVTVLLSSIKPIIIVKAQLGNDC